MSSAPVDAVGLCGFVPPRKRRKPPFYRGFQLLRIKFALLFAVGLLASTSTRGEKIVWDETALGHFAAFHISFLDQVSDGCLPQPLAIKTIIEQETLRSGIRRPERGELVPALRVTAAGSELETSTGEPMKTCVAAVSFLADIMIWQQMPWNQGGVGYLLLYQHGAVISAPKQDFQHHAEESIRTLLKEFLASWTKARQKYQQQ
jgi:hypothetical protein